MPRGSLRLIHRKGCAATGRDARAARACSCAPRLQARLGGEDLTLGYLERGWRVGDLHAFGDRLAEMRDALAQGRPVRRRPTQRLREYAPEWFRQIHAAVLIGTLSPLTYNGYRSAWLRHIEPYFGRRRIGMIDTASINEYIAAKLAAGYREGRSRASSPCSRRC